MTINFKHMNELRFVLSYVSVPDLGATATSAILPAGERLVTVKMKSLPQIQGGRGTEDLLTFWNFPVSKIASNSISICCLKLSKNFRLPSKKYPIILIVIREFQESSD